jgi:hypothetical protein
MRLLAREKGGGGRNEPHVGRRQVTREVHHAARQHHRREERETPRIGFALREVHQLHALRLQQHLHHQRLGRGCEYERVELASQEGDSRRGLLELRQRDLPRIDRVGLEQLVHQQRHAAAHGADVQAQALQLRECAECGRGIHLACSVRAIEQPHRFHEQAAERFDPAFFLRRALVAAALHEAEVGLAFAQQPQVVRGSLAGQQHDVDAVRRQRFLVALAEFVVGALRRPRGERHALGRCRVQPQIGQQQQHHRQQRERTGGNEQLADRQQRVADRLGHVRGHARSLAAGR